ncbi:YitT family protein [Isoptericola sp. NPDC057653]|uniref:membrane protein YczE n=1 Tax=Isoptericola sp. NPDC057653 TaxID=3346195 RepID=UPI003677928D
MSTTPAPSRRPARRGSRRLPGRPSRRAVARRTGAAPSDPGPASAAAVSAAEAPRAPQGSGTQGSGAQAAPGASPASGASGASGASAPAASMGPVRRGVQLVLGLLGFAWSMAMLLHAGEGGMPWDVLHQGLVRSTGLGFGAVVAVTSVLVLLAWIPLRQRPGIGTVANVVVISLAIGPSLTAMAWLVPDPGLAARVALAVGGIVLNGVATAAYIGVRLGPGPRDGLMTGLLQRTGWSVRLVRTGIEVAVVLVGVLLGGTFGWATIAYALGVGPVVQATVRWRWLVPTGLTGAAPVPAARPGPTDADTARRAREISRALDLVSREHGDR